VAYRAEGFETEGVYHLFSRGVDRRVVFDDDNDRQRFLELLSYYRHPPAIGYAQTQRLRRTAPLIARSQLERAREANHPFANFISYCLMPNHFHLLVRQFVDKGISELMRRFLNSYTRYYNERHGRSGPLFAGQYRAVRVSTDAQLLHVSRYIHLNPYVAGLTRDPLVYAWSSIGVYCQRGSTHFGSVLEVDASLILEMLPHGAYENFVVDHADYARQLDQIEHLVLEKEERERAHFRSV